MIKRVKGKATKKRTANQTESKVDVDPVELSDHLRSTEISDRFNKFQNNKDKTRKLLEQDKATYPVNTLLDRGVDLLIRPLRKEIPDIPPYPPTEISRSEYLSCDNNMDQQEASGITQDPERLQERDLNTDSLEDDLSQDQDDSAMPNPVIQSDFQVELEDHVVSHSADGDLPNPQEQMRGNIVKNIGSCVNQVCNDEDLDNPVTNRNVQDLILQQREISGPNQSSIIEEKLDRILKKLDSFDTRFASMESWIESASSLLQTLPHVQSMMVELQSGFNNLALEVKGDINRIAGRARNICPEDSSFSKPPVPCAKRLDFTDLDIDDNILTKARDYIKFLEKHSLVSHAPLVKSPHLTALVSLGAEGFIKKYFPDKINLVSSLKGWTSVKRSDITLAMSCLNDLIRTLECQPLPSVVRDMNPNRLIHIAPGPSKPPANKEQRVSTVNWNI